MWQWNGALLRFEMRDAAGRVTHVAALPNAPVEAGVTRVIPLDPEDVRAIQSGGPEAQARITRGLADLNGVTGPSTVEADPQTGLIKIKFGPSMVTALAERNNAAIEAQDTDESLSAKELALRRDIAAHGSDPGYWFSQFQPSAPAASMDPEAVTEAAAYGMQSPEYVRAYGATQDVAAKGALQARRQMLDRIKAAWEANKAGTTALSAQQDAAWELQQANQYQPPSSVEEGVKLLTPQGLIHTTAAGARQYQAERDYDRAIDRAGVRFGQRPLPRYGIGGVTPVVDEPPPEYDSTAPVGMMGGNPINPTTGGTFAGGRLSPTFGAPPPPPPPTFQQPKAVDPRNTIAGQQKVMDEYATTMDDIARQERQALQEIEDRRRQAMQQQQQRVQRVQLQMQADEQQAAQQLAALRGQRLADVVRNPYMVALPQVPGVAAAMPPAPVGVA